MSIGFSKTFGLDRDILSKALREFEKQPVLSRAEVMSTLGVGGQKAEAVVLWLGKLGLRDNKASRLTSVGGILAKYDPYLEDNFSLWLLHYGLASNPEAEVWYLLTNEFLPNWTEFCFTDAVGFLVSKGIRKADDKHLRADVSIFLKSFASGGALVRIGLIKEQDARQVSISRAVFRRNPPSNLSPYLIGYTIYDQRANKSPTLNTITMGELLTQRGNVGRVFCLSRPTLWEILKLTSSMEYGGLTDIHTTAGLDQVVFRFKGRPTDILEAYYLGR